MATASNDLIADQIEATVLGQCIGDTIGLLTEFMIKEEAKKVGFKSLFIFSKKMEI